MRRTKQTARRSGGLVGRGRTVSTSRNYDFDDRSRDTYSGNDYDWLDPGPTGDPPVFGSLGLINGLYDICCQNLAELGWVP